MNENNTTRIAELTAEIAALMAERDQKIKELQEITAKQIKLLRDERNVLKGRKPSKPIEWFGTTKNNLTDDEITEYHRRKRAISRSGVLGKM